MKGRYLIALIAAAGAALLVAVALRHQSPNHARSRSAGDAGQPTLSTRAPQQPAEVLPPRETAQRMDETAVRGLVADLKLAALRRDQTTQRALVGGLKRHGPMARRVIQEERATTQDRAVLTALNSALEELP